MPFSGSIPVAPFFSGVLSSVGEEGGGEGGGNRLLAVFTS
jgi:hypothetical protein